VSHLYALLGKQIAHFRRRAGLTQEELAEKTGYSVDFIGLVERGINAPTVKRLEDIADVLGIQIWQFFKPFNRRQNAAEPNPYKKNSKGHKSKAGY
jgi:transcriptional regulator with XRE-family HTH domain